MPVIEIKSCAQCSSRQTEPDRTEDSFERPEKWLCGEANNKLIARYQEWNDPDPAVPGWCPLNPDKKEPEPEDRVWVVTARTKVLIAAADADAARQYFDDFDDIADNPDVEVEGPFAKREHLPADLTDDNIWGDDRSPEEYWS